MDSNDDEEEVKVVKPKPIQEQVVKSQIEVFYCGTLNSAPFNPKEVVKSAIKCQGNFCQYGKTPYVRGVQDSDSDDSQINSKFNKCKLCLSADKKQEFINTIIDIKGIHIPRVIPKDSFQWVPWEEKYIQNLHKQRERMLANQSKLKGKQQKNANTVEAYIEGLPADMYDFVQVQCGYNHTLLLNQLGQVVSFGQGLQGQLGLKKSILHQQFPQEVEIAQNGKKPIIITKIKANANDSAAFDDITNKLYVWGAFGLMKKSKTHQLEPRAVELHIGQDNQKKVYALDPQNFKIPGASSLTKIDVIHTVQSIDWGVSHMVFVDRRNRVFAMGQNRYGKTGLGNVLPDNRSPVEIIIQSEKNSSQKSSSSEEEEDYGDQEKISSLHTTQYGDDSELDGLDPIARKVKHYQRTQDKKNQDLDEDKYTAVPTMIEPFQGDDRVADIECGSGHTLAITQKGRIYSWGEGFKGKLGLGYSESLGDCQNQNHPRQIIKGIIPNDRKNPHLIKHVGCGTSISVVLQERGIMLEWGKAQVQKIRFDDYKRYSVPYQIAQDIKVVSLSVGWDHFMMIDKSRQLWGLGENTNGCQGTGDTKYRNNPWRNIFFEGKRVIDVACGDKFTVVIAETFENLNEKIDFANPFQKFFSTKCLIQSTKSSICDQSGSSGNHVPDDLRQKINKILNRNNSRKSRDVTPMLSNSTSYVNLEKIKQIRMALNSEIVSKIITPANEIVIPPQEEVKLPTIEQRKVSKKRIQKTALSNYKQTLDSGRKSKHFNPNPLVPVLQRPLGMQRHASHMISRNHQHGTTRKYTSIIRNNHESFLNITTGLGSPHSSSHINVFDYNMMSSSPSKENLVKGQVSLPRVGSVQSMTQSIGSHRSSTSYNSTKSRYLLPSINQKSNMNPELKNILQKVNNGDIMRDMSNSRLIEDDQQNDLLNAKTIDHYIGKAFSQMDLEKGMQEYRRKKQIALDRLNSIKLNRKATKKKQELEKPETPIMYQFKDNLSSRTNSRNQEERLQKKKEKAQERLNQLGNQLDERSKFYKDILQQNYSSAFIQGFTLKSLDQNFGHLTVEERSRMIDHFIDALDLNLQKYSSLERNKRFLQLIKAMDKRMSGPLSGKKLLSSATQKLEKQQQKTERKNIKILKKGFQGNDMDRVEDYNPYLSRLTEADIEKLNLKVSGSASIKKFEGGLFVGGAGIRKLGNDEAKKQRRV